uniref:Uncharacterized protein n=1 Tax=Panagrolaimus sp. PS1159 TaxID=55785 RepID=A0AC35FJ02_9BILA
MNTKLMIIFVFCIFGTTTVQSISLRDKYHENLVKKSIDSLDLGAFDFKHIADVGGEKILPRSYGSGNDLFFDENGAAFPISNTRFTLGDLLQGSNVAGNQRLAPLSYY